MKLAKMYAAEFKPGGERECIKCSRQSHGNYCAFCIKKTLKALKVTEETLRESSKVFKNSINKDQINQAIAAIEAEIK